MPRIRVTALPVLLAALLAAALLAGCGAEPEKPAAEKPAASEAKSDPTLAEYLEADTMTGEYTVVRTNGSDGGVTKMSGQFWVDGRKFRYSLYENGKLVRDITSPDGKTAYFVQHDAKVSEPSVASVDRYLLEFEEPGEKAVEDGVDKETGATRVVYPIKKLDDMAGADNPWYTEDVTYLVKDGKVIGVITRGDSPNKDGSDYDLDVSRRIFKTIKVGETIPPETFELPYPIGDAD